MTTDRGISAADMKILMGRGYDPERNAVGGGLDLRGTGVTSLPEGLMVGWGLDLRGTGVTSLPEGLRVGGWLYLSDAAITEAHDLNGRHVNTTEEARPYLVEIASRALQPESLDMSVVHSDCGTSHCIAGWAGALFPDQVRAGRELIDAVNLLGIEAAKFFYEDTDTGREFLQQFLPE